MADIDLKTETPDESFDLDAVLVGADSQASASPSVFSATTIWTYLKSLTNTWTGTNTFTGPVVVSGGISGEAGAFYEAGGTDVAIADGGTGSSSAAAARTALGLEIGADVQAYDAVLSATTASFTTAHQSALEAIDTAAELKAVYEGNADTNAYDDAAVAKLGAIEALADVTDATNVTAAGALMDSEVTNLSGIKTLTVPDSTTITAFAATVLDDADAATARATLGVDAAGTDNSTDVTLAGTPDYITLAGQVLTRNAVDLAADVTGNLPVANFNSGTGATSATFWRGDGTWVTPAGAGDMAAATYDPATIAEQLVGLTATQTLTNKTLTSPTIDTPALGADSVDAITEIATAIKSGLDAKLITGTAGTDGNVASWNADGDIIDGGAKREALTAARTYYVRTDGSDSNTGLADSAGGAFLTIQAAIDVVYGSLDIGSYDVTIQVGAGTYAGTIVASSAPIGSGLVTLLGDATTPANVHLNVTGAAILVTNSGARLAVSGLKISATGVGLYATNGGSIVSAGKLEFGACLFHIAAIENSACVIKHDYTISGGATSHGLAATAGVLASKNNTITITGTPAFGGGFVGLQSNAIAEFFNNTFSGSATGSRYNIGANASLVTFTGNTSYLPGNSAGSTSNGGVYT